ncbi:MAG: cation:proton antiporter [Flavobacteriaceae bacterium]|jgi:CPA2 family monovalent cation:H+ antiporter-2|nr:cation:proton antiporter [Flavobacteriaceae bacterium]
MENHLPKLILDLALILGAGAIVTLIFRKIKQPLVLGYIIAGFLVGPHFKPIPNIADTENIKIWAEIGVIFLLFSLGLEFSFKKLLNEGAAVIITAIVKIIAILTLGYFAGQWLGWNTMNSLFLGGMIASSSTIVIIKTFDELQVKRKKFAQVVFGVLIVEDILVVLLMVLLSTMAVSRQFNGSEMITSAFRLLFFLFLWFIFGIFLIPTLLRRAKKLLDDETLLILSIGLCLAMVIGATEIGFSAELGAFIMGSILAETTSAEKIEHLLRPVKDLFGAIFFVSIGMLIDPSMMWAYKWEIFLITLLTIFGKSFFTAVGALLSGQPLKQSVQVGMSMAQIGEFAFIVASLGMSLKVTSDFLFPVAVGVSVITTLTTPYMINFSDIFYGILHKIIPGKVQKMLDQYSTGTQNIQEESKWKKLLKSYLSLVLTNSVVVIGIVMLTTTLLMPFLYEQIENRTLTRIIGVVCVIALCAPFLWAVLAKKPANEIFMTIWNENKYSRGPLVAIEAMRILIVVFLLGFIVDRFYSGTAASIVVIPMVVLVLYLLSTKFNGFYSLISHRFMYNLNERDILNQKEIQIKQRRDNLTPWDSHITDFEVNQDAPYIGKTLTELAWRETFGINIAFIKRGTKTIYAPKADDRIFPFDKLGLIGTDTQLRRFELLAEKNRTKEIPVQKIAQEKQENIVLTKFLIPETSLLSGKNIKESQIRERTHGLIVGLERDGKRTLNPPSDMVLQAGDFVWIVGNKKEIQAFIERANNNL